MLLIAGCSAKNNVPTTNVCVLVNTCDDVSNLLQGGLDTAKYTANSTALPSGSSATCVVTAVGVTPVLTRNFTGIGAGY